MQFVDFSVRPNRTKHPNKRTIIESFTDEFDKLYLLIANKKRYSR